MPDRRVCLFALISTVLLFVTELNAQPQKEVEASGATSTHVRIYPVRPKHGTDKEDSDRYANGLSAYSTIFPGPAGAHLNYYGGPVVSNIQLVVVYYGAGSYEPSLMSGLPSFFTAITSGSFMDMLSEYGTVGQPSPTTNQRIQHGAYVGTYTITPSAANNGSTITDSNIQAELNAQIAAGNLPAPVYDAAGNANTMYMVYFPHGKRITSDGASSCVSGGFCAYHGTFTHLGQDILYGVQPDMQPGSGCELGCGNASTAFQNYTSVASHEFAETITDAAVGLATVFGPPLAWYDPQGQDGEIGDICNATQSTADGYTVQTEWSNLQNGCASGPPTFRVTAPANGASGTAFNVTVKILDSAGGSIIAYRGRIHFTSSDPAATLPADYTYTVADNGTNVFRVTLATSGNQTISVNDVVATGFKGSSSVSVSGSNFSLSASPASLSIQQGTSGASAISTTAIGTPSTINFSVAGLPAGATASFAPNSVTAGGGSTLTVNAGTAAPGPYTLTVTGTSPTATHSTTVALTITGTPPAPDFSINASPNAVTIQQGSNGNSTISTTIVGTAGTVNLSVSGLPSNVTATLTPSSVVAGSSSVLNFVANASAAIGAYTITVTGIEGTNTHSTTVTLTITALPLPPDFTISASPATISAPQGSSGQSTISTVAINSPGSVSLSVSGVPTGATATLTPNSVVSGNSSTLAVNAGTAALGTYTLMVTGIEGANTHSTPVMLNITAAGGAIVNGGFETGNLNGWSPLGSASVVAAGHSGTYAAIVGSTNPTVGDSSISQTFVVPAAGGTLSFYYKVVCPDTVSYDWATATLVDNTAGTTAVVLSRTCTNNSTWQQVMYSLSGVAGHTVTLKLISHDDDYAGDPTYTLYDDVSIGVTTPPPPPPPGGSITNGGFETGNLNGWAALGNASATTVAHTGSFAAALGSTSPTTTSSISQTFTVPAGVSMLSFFYANSCPDTVYYDWATVTLKDNTTNTTYVVLPKTCAPNYAWTQVMYNIAALVGHSVTLTLSNHDDDYPGDPTYTIYDDVAIQ